jgi:nitrate reductase beta subunit
VGRIRYLGVLLYDADRIEEVAKKPDDQLIEAQRSLILDPHDPEVIAAARANGIPIDDRVGAEVAGLQFVKVWKIALPPHIEYRTLPMLFYVPPLSPVMANRQNGDRCWSTCPGPVPRHRPGPGAAEVPGQPVRRGARAKVRYALGKQKAVRWYRRAVTVGDVSRETAAADAPGRRLQRGGGRGDLPADLAVYVRRSFCDPAGPPRAGPGDDGRSDGAAAVRRVRFRGSPTARIVM